MKRGFLNGSKMKKGPTFPPLSKNGSLDPVQSAAPLLSQPNEMIASKLDYGKVENIAVPDDYKPEEITIVGMNQLKTDYGAVTVFTTIPSREISAPFDPDGHSEWIVNGPTKAKVINAPGYLQPVPKPVGPTSYVVKSTPNMGMGVFATRDIKLGELIFAERPLLVTPRGLASLESPNGYDVKTQKLLMMLEYEKQLEIAVGRMLPQNLAAFKSLANSHKEDGSGPLLGIIRTNGFGTGLFDGEVGRADCANYYTAVVNIGSRINHSCMPNVDAQFSITSFSFQFIAKVDIQVGQQLFYAYCGVGGSAAERRAELAPYGFACDCPACVNATPETDRLRAEYEQIAKTYQGKINYWKSRPGRLIAESVINPVLEFRDALKKEGLHWSDSYKDIAYALQMFYEHLGLREKAKPYEEECSRYL